ncbi:histidine kinase [Kitasatospora sp. NBC_01287]|uniref:sensor histidine kinase n=1 Tax=Kitasatospora sp. NBC_01287 TaxID=2903573 RepID=UPI00224F98B9|nr:histidine kinase [Kitasatospora sp. NBC_01287]MCX4747058.1 histidine kinase [Kitasatospora sp. NBC_01287]
MERLAALAALAARRTNVLLGLAFAVVLAATAYWHAAHAGGRGWLLDCGVGAVVCVAALLRERNRLVTVAIGLSVAAAAVLAAGMGYPTGQPGVAASLALTVLAGSAVRVLPPGRAAVVAAAGLAVTVLGRLVTTSHAASSFHMGVQGWLAGLGTGLVLRFLEHRRQTAVEAVRRDERLALARELHDVVAHLVSGIVMHTHAAQIMLRKQPDLLGDALADIERSGTDAMDAMRRVVALLRDAEDGAAVTAGPEQLIDLVRRFEEHGPAVDLRLPTAAPTWPPVVTTTVYRVVQESLTNIARHARSARAATVTISQDSTDITVEIGDDAPPHSPIRASPRGGYGLVGMRERIEALGGTLNAGPQPGAGWSVRATLPLQAGDRP